MHRCGSRGARSRLTAVVAAVTTKRGAYNGVDSVMVTGDEGNRCSNTLSGRLLPLLGNFRSFVRLLGNEQR